MRFAENLKEIMVEHGMTQQAVADAIGVSQRAVSKWVNKQAEPTATNIYNLARFLNVTADELLGLAHSDID